MWNGADTHESSYVDDEMTGQDYPYELARELHYPGRGCVLSDYLRNRFMLWFTNTACGIVRHSPVIEPDCYTDIFRCRMESNNEKSHGVFKIKFPTNKNDDCSGIGIHSMKCDCLSEKRNESKADWESLMSIKYENVYVAACRVGGFFGQKLVYYPLKIRFNEDRQDGVLISLLYHSQRNHVNRRGEPVRDYQSLEFLAIKEGGGWHVKDPLLRDSRLQNKACKSCNHINNKPGQRFRMMFGLDCSKHSVCEMCVYYFFTCKANRDVSVSDSSFDKYCIECGTDEPMADTVSVSFEGCSKMRTPRPVGHFGMKPVIAKSMLDSYYAFYMEHIHFAVCAHKGIRDRIHNLMHEKAHVCYRMDYLNGPGPFGYTRDFNTQFDESILNHEKAWEWLNDRLHLFSWANRSDTRYPKVFLEMDSGYYCVHLNKNEFNIMDRLAEMSTPP